MLCNSRPNCISLHKQVMYHVVKDTFDILPTNGIKKYQINKIIKLAKERAQLLPHHKGGKVIYNRMVIKSPPPSVGEASDYFEYKGDKAIDLSSIAELVELSENVFCFFSSLLSRML